MDQSTIQKIQEISQRAFCTLGAQDYIRIDYRVTADNLVLSIQLAKAARYLAAFAYHRSENVILPLGCFSANSSVCRWAVTCV